MELKTTYFEKPGGDENTAKTLALAKARAAELGIKTIVVASTVGKTSVKAVDVFKGCKVIIVTHTAGFREANTQEFTEESRKAVEAKGGIILTTTHAFGGIHRALNPASMPPPPSLAIGDIVANTLRIFGQGMKVTCEIAAMAADAGLVRTDEEIISIGGTGRGADTAVVLQADYVHRFFNMRVKEIICTPRF
ncbi:MAG: pyruvate kinase alpha/beta domain-containing protein [Dehalococcoidales bacterium]